MWAYRACTMLASNMGTAAIDNPRDSLKKLLSHSFLSCLLLGGVARVKPQLSPPPFPFSYNFLPPSEEAGGQSRARQTVDDESLSPWSQVAWSFATGDL
jgi:hypothetical protein